MYKKFDRILVPMDLSPASLIALDHALFLVKHLKSELHIIHVRELKGIKTILKEVFSDSSSKKEIKSDEEVEKGLKKIVKEVNEAHNINCVLQFLTGTISTQILDYADKMNATLIAMGTYGAKGLENFLIGSNTYQVINHAKCPVLSLHENSSRNGIKNIVLPLDTSKTTREKVDEAIYLAKNFHSMIHILAVSTSTDEKTLNHLQAVSKQVESYIHEDKLATTIEFLTGNNLTEITLNYAKKINADLIIIMTEQEANPNMLAGPYSQQMVNQSNIPVISVNPKKKETEFVTPY